MSRFSDCYDTAQSLEQRRFYRRAVTVWREALRVAFNEDESKVATSGLHRCSDAAKYTGKPETL